MGIEEVLTAPRSPWQNPFVERLIGLIRRECLDHVIIFNERHLRHVLSSYFFNIISGPEPTCHSTRIVRKGAQSSLPCRQDYRLPGGGRSASSLRASRCLSLEVDDPARAGFGVKDRCISDRCAHTTVPRISFHFAPVADARGVRPMNSAAIMCSPIPTPNTFFSKDRWLELPPIGSGNLHGTGGTRTDGDNVPRAAKMHGRHRNRNLNGSVRHRIVRNGP
jgi:hypothetical protein